MAYAPQQWQNTTYVTNSTLSNAIDLGRVYDYIQLDIPAVNNCTFGIAVSKAAGGTYNTLGAATPSVNVGTGSKQEVFKLGGHQFLKLVSSVVQDTPTIYYRGIAV